MCIRDRVNTVLDTLEGLSPAVMAELGNPATGGATNVAAFDQSGSRLWSVTLNLSLIHICSMDWKRYAGTLVGTNLVMILLGYLILRLQSLLFLNPNGIGSMDPSLSFNTIISFMTLSLIHI